MASFYTYDFLYDDVPSQNYDLKILTFEDGGLFTGVGSSEVTILTQRVLRKSKPYFLGRTQETVLEFPLTFGRIKPISAMERDIISSWLFGKANYKKLYILQDDLNGAYFNCFFNTPQPQYIGGVNYAFTANVVCDSPWAYAQPRSISGSANGSIYIYNASSEDDYLYPLITVSFGNLMGDGLFSMINHNESDRETIYYQYGNHEVLTLDNDLQIIRTDYGAYPLPDYPISRFNKNWFRLVPGDNYIDIYSSSISVNYTISFTERMKIGG